MSTARILEEIATERERQTRVFGWTPEHDDKHTKGEMAKAAACYALSASINKHARSVCEQDWSPWWDCIFLKRYWPWHPKWWRPEGRRVELIKAAALIVAELERVDRRINRDTGF